jgi:hypothetical protein
MKAMKKIFAFILFLSVIAGCKKKEVGSVPGNSPPEITSARIVPPAPVAGDEISVSYSTFDRDKDPVEVKIQWLLNGEPTDWTTERIKIPGLRKGALLSCRLIPNDGKEDGKVYETEPVRIINSPPVIKDIGISPVNPGTKDDIKASAEVYDPDDDPVEVEYKWYINNKVVPDVKGDTLPSSYTKKGDIVVVSATPFDGEARGREYLSNPVVVQNSPPVITSNPPSTLEGGRFVYKVEATDPDGDKITFTLKEGPPEASITEDGLLVIQPVPPGEIYVKIEVSDESGATSYQEFRFSAGR